ncbi:hypothetical protein BK147_31255 [Paenibacillus sp. FSL R7-0337]|nr:hypothetical protein BK147_31255 [Paenibacillus sp. FSL R7-0337]
MEINNRIIKHYLKIVLFMNGTAYAGKSTMVKMLADKYGLILNTCYKFSELNSFRRIKGFFL